jgi:hypothetical protein
MDRSLAVFLRSLQSSSQDSGSDAARFEAALLTTLPICPLTGTYRLLPTATSLLLSLNNPLNITLITSQLLSAPSLWNETIDLRACRRIFSVFYTAALELSDHVASKPRTSYNPFPSVDKEKWTTAVVKGADNQSPRWRHVLVLGAILLGFEEKQKQSLPSHLRSKLECALATATNLAIQANENSIGNFAVAFALTHTFELLSDYNQARLKYDIILPVLIEATFSSNEGLEYGYWLGIIDQDVVEVTERKFNWSAKSNTFRLIREMQERPLVASLGPMSRLIAHSVGAVYDSTILLPTLDRVADFARTLWISWRQNKLSEIDASEELDFLDAESIGTTLPSLWQLLRLSLFATVIILRAMMGRLLFDGFLASDQHAPFLAMQCLHILRNLYFISSRLGQTSSSQYLFVTMVAIDILTQYPEQSESFVKSIGVTERGQIPPHPADRCLDLFFFNTAEHLTLTLPPETNEDVVLAGALPYLATGSRSLMEILEAAHSVTLSVLAAPHNADITARHLPFYLEELFKCFPDTLSPRQFRLAFKTMIRISSPLFPLAQSQPLLPSILLETIFEKAKYAPTHALQEARVMPQSTIQRMPALSEQAVLAMAMIDSLCFLHPELLEEWLPLTAALVVQIGDGEMRRACQVRFWEAISGGEMDVERAALCVAWWNTRGGREHVLESNKALQSDHVMSGALPMEGKL